MAFISKTRISHFYYSAGPKTQERARELRQRETKCEKILWKRLKAKNLKVKFRRQHPISFFIADFYCHEARLVIEVDGKIHLKPTQREHDKNRDAEFERLGIHVVRITNEDVTYHIGKVMRKIKEAIATGIADQSR